MKFTMTRIAALTAMAITSPGAHAVLTSFNTLSIQNDAVTSYNATSSSSYVSSNGPLVDSFFAFASKTKQSVGAQFAYLYNGAALTLTGATQSNIATFTLYGIAGSYETIGTGISILSASGDTATVDMSGWKADWNGIITPLGTGAWSTGFTNGVGNLTCTVGSGCAAGSAYTLKYTATVPDFWSPTPYYLELHGTVGAVPEASTFAMMLAGLGVVAVAARRRKTCSTA
jgi:hypothetical protein